MPIAASFDYNLKFKMPRMNPIILRVMNTYKHMPCLWDKTHKDYKHKYIRKEAQEALLEVYKEFDPNASVRIMLKKIQMYRTNYVKELIKVRESMCKGETYVPTLWYYDALSFLEDVVSSDYLPTVATDCLDAESEASEDIKTEYLSVSEEDSEFNGSSSSTPPLKRRKISEADYVPHENVPEWKMDHENVAESIFKDEEWEIIGKSIGIQLRDLEEKQLAIAQKIISKIIYYGKMEMLGENSCVALQNDMNSTETISTDPYYFVPITNPKQSPHFVSSSTFEGSNPHIINSLQIPPEPEDPLVKSEPVEGTG